MEPYSSFNWNITNFKYIFIFYILNSILSNWRLQGHFGPSHLDVL